jgi:hypothetical protein
MIISNGSFAVIQFDAHQFGWRRRVQLMPNGKCASVA